MTHNILDYCKEHNVEYLFLDFFGTIVRRNCTPEEVKILWAKKLALKLNYAVDETMLFLLRKKAEQAVISRAEAGEFNYPGLCDEIYRRLVDLDKRFSCKYVESDFYKIAHAAEIQAELASQSYIGETVTLVTEAHQRGLHVVVVSDFYLGQEELRIFLQREDVYNKVERIFVSSDCKTSKHLGGLYGYVCKKMNIDPSQCVMVGDNQKSDVQMANNWGIKAFRLDSGEGKDQHKELVAQLKQIAKRAVSGILGYSNYCFLLYLYAERLYKELIREEIQDIYFLSREGEFLKKVFDLYLEKIKDKSIHTHYLYVSRKATYPASLKPLGVEQFALLRRYPQLSVSDFLENTGMASISEQLQMEQSEICKPIQDFFNSPTFLDLCAREDFQQLYESSRIRYRSIFRRYCAQEGMTSGHTIAVADVGWNGTMQDNNYNSLEGIDCAGFYIGIINSAFITEDRRKNGLIFAQNPINSRDMDLWQYDHVFLERLLWASHGATDHYQENEEHKVVPVLKEYVSEEKNHEKIMPVQQVILQKISQLCDRIQGSCYSAECLYELFLNIHLRTLYLVNNQQLELQRSMVAGQMQNFGHLSTAGDSIGSTFSKINILKKAWKRRSLLKNTEVMFRIFLNHNIKLPIRMMYFFHYVTLQREKKTIKW